MANSGKEGLEAFCCFIGYFVGSQGLDFGFFEGKIELFNAEIKSRSKAVKLSTAVQAAVEDMNHVSTANDVSASFESTPIDVDLLPDSNTITPHVLSSKSSCQPSKMHACKGYILALPPGHSPHIDYPFALHHYLRLPWDYGT
ncbi:hypothetical protein EV421DRAFT_1907202 [Armillaria borealis]|uniref:Uncharacterized protein n=1 Tax=Armillaria borealis TaxID=47425 RepID=A0AA39MLD3_9AGAR|nr:hypothetical protein EV421DRAFT_1907202 [Armillaria borealis]